MNLHARIHPSISDKLLSSRFQGLVESSFTAAETYVMATSNRRSCERRQNGGEIAQGSRGEKELLQSNLLGMWISDSPHPNVTLVCPVGTCFCPTNWVIQKPHQSCHTIQIERAHTNIIDTNKKPWKASRSLEKPWTASSLRFARVDLRCQTLSSFDSS